MSNSKYMRKNPTVQKMDLILSCGHTVVAEHNPDGRSAPPQYDESYWCKACREIVSIREIIPWNRIIIK